MMYDLDLAVMATAVGITQSWPLSTYGRMIMAVEDGLGGCLSSYFAARSFRAVPRSRVDEVIYQR